MTSFLVFLEFSKTKQRGEGSEQQQQTYNLPKVKTFSTDYKYHLNLTFIIHNKYLSTLYLYIYIHI